MEKKIETKKDEIRYFTSDPKRMLDKYLVNDVVQTWYEDFTDEDTQEVVSIERKQFQCWGIRNKQNARYNQISQEMVRSH